MIDLPPEQAIEQRLGQCGLNSAGFTIAYDDDLQGSLIVIRPEAGAKREQFRCIQEAAALSTVVFADSDMDREYSKFEAELIGPKMLQNASKSLEKIGRLKNFPIRSAYASEKLFAEAIEVHCGVPKGRALKEFGGSITFMPPPEDYSDANKFSAMYDCLSTAIIYVTAKGELAIGFIGNEAVREIDSQ